MDILRRAFSSLAPWDPKKRIIHLATLDDMQIPEEDDIRPILEAVRDPILGPDVYVNTLQEIRGRWTWKTVLKGLVIIHRIYEDPKLSSDVLKICESRSDGVLPLEHFLLFREGETTDIQAEVHSGIIKKHAQFLIIYKQHCCNELSLLYKGGIGFDEKQGHLDLQNVINQWLVALNLLELGAQCFPELNSRTGFVTTPYLCAISVYSLRFVLMSTLRIYGLVCSIVPYLTKEYQIASSNPDAFKGVIFGYQSLELISSKLSKQMQTWSNLPGVFLTLPLLDELPPYFEAFPGAAIASPSLRCLDEGHDVFILGDGGASVKEIGPTLIGNERV